MPCPVGRHVRRRCLGWVEKALEVGIDDGIDIFFGVIGGRLGNEDTGVVDQDIDLAEGFDGVGKQGLGRRRFGDVTGDQQEVRWVTQFGRRRFQAFLGAGIADHVIAPCQVGLCDGKTQAAGGAGDNYGLNRAHGRIP
ncbi:hypothetical protein D9M71_529760 [compost metagenome]